ncbi:hypothetical protein ACP26L_06670 [Paenibacillus sp. S-38]|uniref:hypothetical protein n=1 Tax=Paenibacillus sp. S-38 TaxID=3416710 RepID=UPI003CECBABD
MRPADGDPIRGILGVSGMNQPARSEGMRGRELQSGKYVSEEGEQRGRPVKEHCP